MSKSSEIHIIKLKCTNETILTSKTLLTTTHLVPEWPKYIFITENRVRYSNASNITKHFSASVWWFSHAVCTTLNRRLLDFQILIKSYTFHKDLWTYTCEKHEIILPLCLEIAHVCSSKDMGRCVVWRICNE